MSLQISGKILDFLAFIGKCVVAGIIIAFIVLQVIRVMA